MKTIKEEMSKFSNISGSNVALSAILNDGRLMTELRLLGLSKENVIANMPLISAYQDDRKYCEKCPGLEKCVKEPSPQMEMKIKKENGHLSRIYSPCHLYIEQDMLRKSYIYRDFADEWLSFSFSTIRNNSERFKSFMKEWNFSISHPDKNWLYLEGEMGSGRSFLLACAANTEAGEGHSKIAYINANRRFDELKSLSVSNKYLFAKQMDLLENCDLLVIDDFGSEFKSDYVRDQIVLPLLFERSKKNLRVYFTSDYTLDEIRTLYGTNRAAEIQAKVLVETIKARINKITTIYPGVEAKTNAN
jgi:primosomal protein DnaI